MEDKQWHIVSPCKNFLNQQNRYIFKTLSDSMYGQMSVDSIQPFFFSFFSICTSQGKTQPQGRAKSRSNYMCSCEDRRRLTSNEILKLRSTKTPWFYSQYLEHLEKQTCWSITKWPEICRLYKSPAQWACPFPFKPGKTWVH